MMKQVIILLVGSIMAVSADAAIVDNNAYLIDTQTGLRWLDFTVTQGMSYSEVMIEVQKGSLSDWRYASLSELKGFLENAGLIFNLPEGSAVYMENSSISNVLDYMGTTSINESYRDIFIITGTEYSTDWYRVAHIVDGEVAMGYVDSVELNYGIIFNDGVNQLYGSALVSSVPLPSAAWFLGSSMTGLFMYRRRKIKQKF